MFLYIVVINYLLGNGNGKESGKISGRIVDSDMHDVGRFLNRLLGLAPDIQNRFAFILIFWVIPCTYINRTKCWCYFRLFEYFVCILDLLTLKARADGNIDSGIVDIKANKIELQGPPKVVNSSCFVGFVKTSNINICFCRLFMLTACLGRQLCCLLSRWIEEWHGRYFLFAAIT